MLKHIKVTHETEETDRACDKAREVNTEPQY